MSLPVPPPDQPHDWPPAAPQPDPAYSPQPTPAAGLPLERRSEILTNYLHQATATGWRIESQGPSSATLVSGQPINHVLHLLLTLVTCGLWGVIWLVISMDTTMKRASVLVDETGQVHWRDAIA